MTHYKNRCIYRTDTAGTGSLVLGELLDGTFFPLAEDDDGKAYNYVLTEGSEACEYGTGVYDHASGTLTREVTQSTNEDTPIELSGEGAVLAIGDVAAADLDTLTVLVDALTVVSGRVGLGVEVPTERLDVAGSQRLRAPSGSTVLRIDRVAGQSGEIQFRQDGTQQFAMGAMQNSIAELGNRYVIGAYRSGGNYQPGVVMDSSGSVAVGSVNTTISQFYAVGSDPTKPAAVLQAAVGQSSPVLEVRDSAGNVGARITAAGEFSNSQTPLGEQFGAGATTSGIRGTAVGEAASAAHYGVAVGQGANNTNSYSVAVGASASSAAEGIAIGRSAQAGVRQFVAGSSNAFITDVFFGKGTSNAEPTSYTINGTGGSGTNVVGGNLILAPGKSTGNATPASVIIKSTTTGSSGSTAQTLVDTLTVQGGNIIIALPTSDPGVSGALWNDEGTLKISAG